MTIREKGRNISKFDQIRHKYISFSKIRIERLYFDIIDIIETKFVYFPIFQYNNK